MARKFPSLPTRVGKEYVDVETIGRTETKQNEMQPMQIRNVTSFR
jgi:hypothetical protein